MCCVAENRAYNLRAMGDIPENEQAWERYARANDIRCQHCNQLIPFGERKIYFETKNCSLCDHNLKKDD